MVWDTFDVAVIGAGHAGIEAALASARLGLETVIFTASADERALTDFRELFFFLLAGVVLAWSYELEPPKKRK